MKLSSFSAAASGLILALGSTPAVSQTGLNSLASVVSVITPEKVIAKKNSTLGVDITIQVKSGYHVNSTTPSDEYLIPLKLTFTLSPLAVGEIAFPKPKMQKFQFSPTPISVYEGDIKATAQFKIPASASSGTTLINGKLSYQACSERACLAPRTIHVKIPVEIRN